MPAFIVTIAAFFGISPLRIIVYGAIIVSVIVAGLTIRHNLIEKGRLIERQVTAARDNAALGNSDKAEADVRRCYAQGGDWRGLNEGGPKCVR